MFDAAKFQALRKGRFGTQLHYFDIVDSTNNLAADLARRTVEEGTVVLTDSQTEGRGRNAHAWYSPAGVSLYFTLVLYPPAPKLQYLPFLSGLAIAETLDLWHVDSDLKWPNDVLVNGKKIAGVLIQTSLDQDRLSFALAGIGINLNTRNFPGELESLATSIYLLTGREVDREEFLSSLLRNFEQNYQMITSITWEELTCRLQKRSSFLEGCDVQIEQQGKTITGTTAGLDSLGGLILITQDGREIIYAGEVQACRKR